MYDKYDSFKKDLIRRYHTPLEQQGHYINHSITKFRDFSTGVSKKSLVDDTEFGKVLGIDGKSVRNSEVKLVIITCIKYEDHRDDDTKKTILDQSMERSLEFAHCVNPLKSEQEGYHKCVETSPSDQSGGGSPQFALSRRGIERLQRFGLFTLVKAVRFKYYEQNLSKLKPDIILLTDRMASLLLTIVLLVLNEDAVATGVIFDQVLSSALWSVRSQDEKMLLLPFYLPFV